MVDYFGLSNEVMMLAKVVWSLSMAKEFSGASKNAGRTSLIAPVK
jgi:hypothetical protein